jgi:hypothetical protein
MRVELTIDGGFANIPGLARPIALDGSRLASTDADEMRRRCQAALLVKQGTAAKRRQSMALPDARRYHLTIDIDGKRHELTAADPIDLPAVAALIAFVREHGATRNP